MLSSFFLSSQLWVYFSLTLKRFLKACSRMNSFKTPHRAIQTLQVVLGQFFVWFVSLKLCVQLSPRLIEFCCCSYIVLFLSQIHHRFCEQRILLLFLQCSVSESNTSPILRTECVVPTVLCFWVKYITDSANRECCSYSALFLSQIHHRFCEQSVSVSNIFSTLFHSNF